MSEANNHEFDGPTQYPRLLEGSKPENPKIIDFQTIQQEIQSKRSQRWRTPLEIGMVLVFAIGVGYAGWTMNSQDQAIKDATFAAAKATSQAEVNQASARATEFAAVVIPTATVEPTATAEPSPTTLPTVEPTKAATATPEAPQVVYKTVGEVIPILIKEAQKGNPMVVDVWSDQGVKVEETGSTAQRDTIAFNGYKAGDTFASPIAGKVDYVATTKMLEGAMVRTINIFTEKIPFAVVLNPKDEVLVKDGDDIIPGTPLAKLTGELLPVNSGFYKNGVPYRCQVDLVAGIDKRDIFGKNSILKENGMVVNIVPQSGK